MFFSTNRKPQAADGSDADWAGNPYGVNTPNMSRLLDLVPEILFEINSHLSQGDRLRLSLACKDLNVKLLPELYRYNYIDNNHYALWWACITDGCEAARRVLGQNPANAKAPFDLTMNLQDWIRRLGDSRQAPFISLTYPDKPLPMGKMYPLSVASRNGSHTVAKLLLSNGADPNAQDEIVEFLSDNMAFMRPINWALDFNTRYSMKKLITIDLLVQHGADINKAPELLPPTEDASAHPRRDAPIFRALDVQLLTEPRFGYLIPKRRNSGVKEYMTHVTSILAKQLTVLRRVLCLGGDPNLRDHKGRTPLLCLLDEFRNYRPQHAFDHSIATKQEDDDQREIVQKHVLSQIDTILEYGANLHETASIEMSVPGLPVRKVTALHLACRLNEHHEGIAKHLINLGSDVNATDGWGRTPLFEYCENLSNDPDLLEFFLKKGAHVNHQCSQGRTLLHVICDSHGIGVTKVIKYVKLLVSYGAAVDLQDCQGHTAEYYATMSHDDDTASYLKRIRGHMGMIRSQKTAMQRGLQTFRNRGVGLARPGRGSLNYRARPTNINLGNGNTSRMDHKNTTHRAKSLPATHLAAHQPRSGTARVTWRRGDEATKIGDNQISDGESTGRGGILTCSGDVANRGNNRTPGSETAGEDSRRSDGGAEFQGDGHQRGAGIKKNGDDRTASVKLTGLKTNWRCDSETASEDTNSRTPRKWEDLEGPAGLITDTASIRTSNCCARERPYTRMWSGRKAPEPAPARSALVFTLDKEEEDLIELG